MPDLQAPLSRNVRGDRGARIRRFMSAASEAALHSTDRSTRVGCVIVGSDDQILSIGFNSFTAGADPTREERHERPAKYKWTEHAERNAIYDAARRGVALEGASMYLPWFPCVDCARAIVQSGIKCLVAHEPDLSDPRWGEDFVVARQLLQEGGVRLDFVDEESEPTRNKK